MKKIILLFSLFLLFIAVTTQAQTAQLWGMTPTGGLNTLGIIFKMNLGGTGFDTVYSFSTAGGDIPYGDLLNAPNGKLYGTTFYGGLDTNGTIFSYDPDSNKYADVHDFSKTTGYQSNGSLILAHDGKLYGMATGGGAHNNGAIFSFNPANNSYADVHDFDSTGGAFPYGSLFLASNNKLYGMALEGGATNNGVIFSYDPSTNTFTDLHDFDGTNGSEPSGNLVQSGNKLYGATPNGGANGYGVLFSYNISSSTFLKFYDFNLDSGATSYCSLIQAVNGTFYGTTYYGGTNGDGVIFSFDTLTSTYHDVFNFNGTDGQSPPAGLTLASDGNLYGMTQLGGTYSVGVVFSFDPSNSDCNDLHNFDTINGEKPNGNLIEIGNAGINQLATNNTQLLIYPNPASNQVTIISNQLAVREIRMEDILGQTVLNYPVSNQQYKGINKTIDLSTLSPGMYFVNVISGNIITTGNILVAR